MAENAIIGALRVVLGADTAALEKGLKHGQSMLATFGGGVATAGLAIAGAMAAVGTAVAVAVKGAIDEADKLSKMSQSIGVPVDELSRLKYAAELSDVSLEALGTSVGKLSKNMVSVAGGGVGPAAEAFKALGISVQNSDGSLKSSTAVMTEVAGKFGNMQDGAGKTALAIALFGKAGASMIPMLNDGADGLQKMMREAEELGLVIDSKTGKSAEAFNDNLTRLGKVKNGITVQIMARMLPAFESLSQILIDAAKNSGVMDLAATTLTFALRSLVTGGVLAAATFKALADVVGAVASSIMLVAQGQFSQAWEALKKGPSDVVETVKGTVSVLDTLWGGTAANMAAAGTAANEKFAAPIMKAASNAKNALESFLISQQKSIAATNAHAETVGKSNAEQARMKVTQEALAIATANNIVMTDAYRLRIDALAASAAAAAMKLQGSQLTQEVMTPAEQYEQKLQLQTQLFEAGAISAETYARAQEKAAQDAGASWDTAGSSMAGSFAKIGSAFAEESSSMAAIAKIAGVIQATISMYTGAANALILPFPKNLAAMATVLATGASLIASLKSTSVPKFATGGMMRVGGAGGTDSQRVAMDVSPGELVEVHQNQYGSQGSGGDAKVIDLRGMNLRPVWSLDNVRDLIETINQVAADGMRIRIAPA